MGKTIDNQMLAIKLRYFSCLLSKFNGLHKWLNIQKIVCYFKLMVGEESFKKLSFLQFLNIEMTYTLRCVLQSIYWWFEILNALLCDSSGSSSLYACKSILKCVLYTSSSFNKSSWCSPEASSMHYCLSILSTLLLEK